jgi:hypothetical protein
MHRDREVYGQPHILAVPSKSRFLATLGMTTEVLTPIG